MKENLQKSNNFCTFEGWIGRTCKPSDKGKLTAFPRFTICQQKFNNVSNMLKFEELPEVNSERWLSLEDLPGEEWRDAKGYEDRFKISNYGRVKRKQYTLFYLGKEHVYREKIYRLHIRKYGYRHVSFNTGKKVDCFAVHRLVAKAFIPNPYNYPFINHKDENPSNNVVFVNEDGSIDYEKSNLEWCTPLYNSNYGLCRERIKMSKVYNGIATHIKLYHPNGEVIREYLTYHEAAKELCISRFMISECCNSKYHTACGLYLRKANTNLEKGTNELHQYMIKYRNQYQLLSSFTKKEMEVLLNNIGASGFCKAIHFNNKRCDRVTNLELFTINGYHFLRFKNGRKMVYIYLKL